MKNTAYAGRIEILSGVTGNGLYFRNPTTGEITTVVDSSGNIDAPVTTSRVAVTGDATSGFSTATGTFTNGLLIGGTVTTGVSIGAATTGLVVTGATTNAVRVTGNATSAFSTATGSFTTGLLVGGTVTTGVSVGACTTAFTVTGAATNGLSITGVVTNAIRIDGAGTFLVAFDAVEGALSTQATALAGLSATHKIAIGVDAGGLTLYIPVLTAFA
ncbi:hypothetical protein KBA63_00075 [Candidatus Woesebacteria bacterium]|nr:hypothetical protein [Candidatus Woesebacteria bacterium]